MTRIVEDLPPAYLQVVVAVMLGKNNRPDGDSFSVKQGGLECVVNPGMMNH